VLVGYKLDHLTPVKIALIGGLFCMPAKSASTTESSLPQPTVHTRVPHQMKLLPWTCLLATILIATTTTVAAADQTIFDKSLIQRRPEVHPLTCQSFLE
jgi:hypothetical protein